VRDFSDCKEIVLRFSGTPPELQGADWGEIIAKDAVTLRLRVSFAQATSISRRALDLPGLEDIRIEAMPIEDVIRRVFSGKRS
jgi:ABC-type uncharacterized transport system ATPase subunit